MKDSERASFQAIADVVESWEPGVAFATSGDAAAVAVGVERDGVLEVEVFGAEVASVRS